MPASSKRGAKVRQLREMRSLSTEQLAARSQCHIDLLQQIEAGELVPSLTPLMNISRALGVRLGTLLDDEAHDGPVLVKAGDSSNVMRFSGKDPLARRSTLDFHAVGANKKDRHMEPFLIDVQPPGEEVPPLSSHEGEEFIYVLSGKIEICYGKQIYHLEVGDSIYYDSIVPHDVHACEAPARILAVVYAPF
jgi:transcriptional regulator with XRE-family HTH domain